MLKASEKLPFLISIGTVAIVLVGMYIRGYLEGVRTSGLVLECVFGLGIALASTLLSSAFAENSECLHRYIHLFVPGVMALLVSSGNLFLLAVISLTVKPWFLWQFAIDFSITFAIAGSLSGLVWLTQKRIQSLLQTLERATRIPATILLSR